jgi:Protein of unknown function (DUF3341)
MFDRHDAREDSDYTRGALAEFESEDAIIEAVRALRVCGYSDIDAITPRPIEALQELIAPVRSKLPRYVFVAGVFGAVTALAIEWWCNAWDYPINVGGRPAFSWPAFIPIAFEIMVLFAASTAFFGVLLAMRLPRLAAPIFDAPGIERASIDRFWLLVSADDPQFEPQAVSTLLRSLGGEQVAIVPSAEVAP